MKMTSICVFCGSNTGFSAEYATQAQELGALLVAKGIRLVYGGGNVGLMGAIADEMLSKGGEVIGVIPDFLMKKEVGHRGLTQMIVVETMHERKQQMADLSDGFIALPGGFGTMDELCEILTWAQLGLHHKPIGVLDSGHYYQALIDFLDHMVSQGFLHPQNRAILLHEQQPEALLSLMSDYVAPQVPKWLNRDQI